MDPLSITAGVLAVVHLVNKTLSTCMKLRRTFKEIPNGLGRIVEETRCLRNIFEALQSALDDTPSLQNQASSTTTHEGIWRSLRDVLSPCRVLLEDLNQQLVGALGEPASKPGTTVKRLVTTVRWHLKEPQVRQFLERFERCKSQLTVALTAHQSTLLLDIRTTTISYHTKMEASQTRLEDKLDDISGWKADGIWNWLSPVTFRASHLDTTDQHHTGTCTWVTTSDEFREWFQGDAQLLWLNGAPGAGKTQIFAYIAEYLLADAAAQADQPLVAYAYCDFRKPESLEPLNILGSIVAQCYSETCVIPGTIQDAFTASKPLGRDANPQLDLLHASIMMLLENRKLYILIDALDESQKATKLCDLLRDICREDTHLKVKILLTGRNTESLEETLANDLQIRLSDHKKEVSRDIETYINSRIQSDQRLQWLPPDVKKDITAILNQDSKFRWVQCQLDAISPLRSIKAIRQAITKLPSGLEETYTRILSSIPQHNISTTRSALELLCFCVMPLSLIELHEALAIETRHAYIDDEARLCSPMDILTLGNSLFDLSSTGQIHLAHLSVRDYLLAPESVKDRSMAEFKFKLEESHRELTLKCLTYLLLESLRSGPAATADDYLQRLKKFPFLRYAASAWPYHANHVLSQSPDNATSGGKAKNEEMLALIMEFFSPQRRDNFMAWVQVINAHYGFKWDVYPRSATSLYYAASFGLDSIVETLLASSDFNSADLNAPGSRYGGTPVHAAAYRRHISTVRILLEAGANPAKPDLNRVTPLHSAAANGDLTVMRILLDRLSHEEANSKDGVGETAHDWAIGAGQSEAAELLRSMVGPSVGNTAEETTTPTTKDTSTIKDERSVSPPLGPVFMDQPVGYFPDFYSKRSGLDSSIVVGVNISKKTA